MLQNMALVGMLIHNCLACNDLCFLFSAVEESIEYFPELVNLKDDDGKTPLHIAIANDHFHLATYLMEMVSIFNLYSVL